MNVFPPTFCVLLKSAGMFVLSLELHSLCLLVFSRYAILQPLQSSRTFQYERNTYRFSGTEYCNILAITSSAAEAPYSSKRGTIVLLQTCAPNSVPVIIRYLSGVQSLFILKTSTFRGFFIEKHCCKTVQA